MAFGLLLLADTIIAAENGACVSCYEFSGRNVYFGHICIKVIDRMTMGGSEPRLGAALYHKYMHINKNIIKLRIWTTTRKEKFKRSESLATNHYNSYFKEGKQIYYKFRPLAKNKATKPNSTVLFKECQPKEVLCQALMCP